MSDIFVSYAREDREAIRTLAARLTRVGWSVWWDRHILAGKDFDEVVQRELDKARAVVVAWSAHSVASRWVKAEAGEGLRRELLVPIQLDAALPPLNFRNIQTVTFADVPLDAETPAFQDLIDALTDLLGAPARPPLAVPPAATAAPAPAEAVPPQRAAEPPVVHESAPVQQQEPAREQKRDQEQEQEHKDHDHREGHRTRRSLLPVAIGLGIAALVAGYFLLPFLGVRDRARDADGPPAPVSSQPKQDTPPVAAPVAAAPATAKAPDTKAADERPPSRPEALSDAAIREFVDKLLQAAASGDAQRVLPFYADRVDYYAMGVVGLDVIRQDKQTYYARWPEVKLTWERSPVVIQADDAPNTVNVTYLSTYDVTNPVRRVHASGTATTLLRVALVDGALKIVRQRETVKATRQ